MEILKNNPEFIGALLIGIAIGIGCIVGIAPVVVRQAHKELREFVDALHGVVDKLLIKRSISDEEYRNLIKEANEAYVAIKNILEHKKL